jgi:pimeloyl-ACP methyl ester carboxylesterase
LVLVGCGTFDPAARLRMRATLDTRINSGLQRRLEQLPDDLPDPNECLRATGDLLLPAYSYDLTVSRLDAEVYDARAYNETWKDMLRLQEEGIYPAAFGRIQSPVLMLHGADDPNPGQLIHASLKPYLPYLEYHELARCGHYPWWERHAQAEFFAVLLGWLSSR